MLLRQMPEQLRLEAEPLAAVPRSCSEAQPLAQTPTLALGLLCHSADLTDGPHTYPDATKGPTVASPGKREAGTHQDSYPLLLPPTRPRPDHHPTSAAGTACGPRNQGAAWLGLSHCAIGQGGCAVGVSCCVSVLPLQAE